MGETIKAKNRREREGWFSKYAPPNSQGIDLGCQTDPLYEHYRKWDVIFGDGDATFMEGVADNSYEVVYASHLLEHIKDPVTAVQNWYRILAPGGKLIILVPHKNLYERKAAPPSNWNHEHIFFYLPSQEEPPFTKSLLKVIQEAIPNLNLLSFRVLDEGFDYTIPAHQHAVGEYSIEAIITK